MIRSEVRAQVAANQPAEARGADAHDGQPPRAAAAPPPQVDRPALAPGGGRPPWLVRNSRKATIALVLATFAASPFAYRYLQREFGPDPLAGIKVDPLRIDAASGISEVVKPAEVKPAEVKLPDGKSSAMKPAPAAGAIGPAPKLQPTRPTASPARPAAASLGVTHTRSAVAAPAKEPAARSPEASQSNATPRASASEERTASRACTEAVAALGLCNPDPTAKGK